MYKVGQVLSIVLFSVNIALMTLLLVFADEIFGSAKNQVNDTNAVEIVAFYPVKIFLWFFLAFNLAGLVLSSWALHNIVEVQKGEAKFSEGLAYSSGVFSLISNVIGGLLILIGITSAKKMLYEIEKHHYNESRVNKSNFYDDYHIENSGKSRDRKSTYEETEKDQSNIPGRENPNNESKKPY